MNSIVVVSVSSGGSVTIITHTHAHSIGAETYSPSQVKITASVGKLLLSVAMLLYICIHLLLNYTQNVRWPYTCPNTKRSFLASCNVRTSIIKTLSNSDWYKRLVHLKPHCTCAHTVPLVGGRCHDTQCVWLDWTSSTTLATHPLEHTTE